jgi:large subunit ribosomal protein L18
MAVNKKIKGSVKERARRRRSGKAAARIAVGKLPRLRIRRSNQHMMVQLQTPEGDKTLAQVATTNKDFGADFVRGVARTETAKKLGAEIAKRAIAAGHKQVAFDRAGYKYHGVVKALADAAREKGLEF